MNTDYTLSENQLEQALAANERMMQAIEKHAAESRNIRKVALFCAIAYLIMTLVMISVAGIIASGVKITIDRQESSVVQDSGDSNGNNVYLDGDSTTYNEKGVE